MKHSVFSIISATALMSVLLTGCIVHVGAGEGGGNVDGVFGGIDIESGHSAKNLSMVNGSIEMESNSSARNLSTVNGSIELADNVSIRSAETVNGSIEAGQNLHVERSLETVNGEILLETGADIGDNIENINGDLRLVDTRVGGNVETHNGDVELLGDTHIQGDVTIRRNRDKSWIKWNSDNEPTLTIGANVQIDGEIVLERPVDLKLENSALSHKVVRRFSDK
ncbi:hypothetical protein [Lacimicrobium alkaliphilum]|uniref:Adhesin domain-containing protein n=1 Tax=Lacimicrobium alkaliphilum TaxID=1526571 RepID=A0ABQ1R9S4_9ALTE|nr:hypothetical protein [Lacimicrobium alkaliphilum]GGD59805.1 hypothetical protein GCM10011357_13840 [Lacimicrobium alkaliphilum]